MAYEQILYEKQGHVALITLNRPERLNAWTRQMSGELTQAIGAANDDAEIGAVVVTGAGRAFCAGADVKDGFQRNLQRLESGQQQSEGEQSDQNGDRARPSPWVELARTSKPLIAAVNGVAVGVGLTMILPFDIIIASEEARFGMFFIKMGLVPELASTYFLSQRAGFSYASEMCLSGRLVPGEEAARIGLANRVVRADLLLSEALHTAEAIAANPSRQLRWIKGLITQNASDPDYNAVMTREHTLIAQCYSSPEHKEAVQAFVQKRPADFRKAVVSGS